MYRRATRRTRRGNHRTTPIQAPKSGVKKSQNSSQKVLSDVPPVQDYSRSSNESHSNEVSEGEMVYSSSGSSQGRDSPLTCGIMAEFNGGLQEPRLLGLRCEETWELPSGKRHRTRSKVCDEGEQVLVLPNRPTHVVKSQEEEDRDILRVSGQIDAGRKKFRRTRRYIPGYDSHEPAEAPKVQDLLSQEGKEGYEGRFRRMGSIRYTSSTSGFSSTGSLAELQPLWEEETLQTEATVAPWGVQSWEDYTSGEIDEILSSLYGSDGLQES